MNPISRRLLARWTGWYFFSNIIVLMFIGMSYARMLPDFHQAALTTTAGIMTAWVFLIIFFIVQFTIVSFAGLLIIWLGTLLLPKRWFIFPLAVLLATSMVVFFIIDSIVFHLYHLHLAGVVWHILLAGVAGDVLALSWLEWLIAAILVFIFLCIEILMAFFIWKKVKKAKPRGAGYTIASILACLILIAYTTTLTALGVHTKNMTLLSNLHLLEIDEQYVPYYNDVLGLILPAKNSGLNLQIMGGGFFFQASQITKPLNYPLHSLQCKRPQKSYNIVFIILDDWRADAMTAKITPNIYQFSKTAWNFTDHYSGGNCTGPGIFSLFYSMPHTYWTAMLQQKRPPVFIRELMDQSYQMGIFRSASLHYPAFDKTVFLSVKPLRINTPGKYAYQRDKKITEYFENFLKHLNPNKPFFSFVFYDTSHNYCEKPNAYPHPFKPTLKVCDRIMLSKDTDRTPFFNVYKNAAHFDDALTGQVLNALKQGGFLKNTIVIITADHGEQLNDNHQDLWGHASDYSHWQLQVPFIVYLPGQPPKTMNYFTSHYDVAPFLMKHFLNCSNNSQDYSVGAPLLKSGDRNYLLAASYIDYAMIQKNKNRITRIYPDGNIRIYNDQDLDIPGATIDKKTIKVMWKMMNQYFVNGKS